LAKNPQSARGAGTKNPIFPAAAAVCAESGILFFQSFSSDFSKNQYLRIDFKRKPVQ
jgi:hypothetical protein